MRMSSHVGPVASSARVDAMRHRTAVSSTSRGGPRPTSASTTGTSDTAGGGVADQHERLIAAGRNDVVDISVFVEVADRAPGAVVEQGHRSPGSERAVPAIG